MFLVMSLMVVSVVYWVSALLAEMVFVSDDERTLPIVIRTGFGFFFSVLYFSATWQIVSISYAWLLAGLLLSLYLYGKYGSQCVSVTVSRVRGNIREHIKYFFIFLMGANIFFAPMFVSSNFGPFTEGGGDISIYAEVSQVLARKNLTEFGKVGELRNIADNLNEIVDITLDRTNLEEIIEKRYRSFDENSINPPNAEVAANRVIASQSMGVFMYAPYGQYNFLAGEMNYHVYFGIQAFLYCIILVSVWFFFRRFGYKAAILGMCAIMFSHGLISVFYNVYAAQAFAIALTILILSVVPHVRLNSWAGLRTYGVGLACLWALYVHFLTILLPVALVSWSSRFFSLFEKNKVASVTTSKSKRSYYQTLSELVSISIFTAFLLLFLFAASKNSLTFLHYVITSVFSAEKNVYFGDHIPFFSIKGLSFLFGILSQQHYLPFVTEYVWLSRVVTLGVVMGGIVLLLGSFLMLNIYRASGTDKYQKGFCILYVVLMVIVAPHIYLSQFSLYTQAKGSQNTLVIFYVMLMLPLAMGLNWDYKNKIIKYSTKLLFVAFVLFCLAIAVPRIVFGLKLAYGQERAAILESSYFLEAKKIRGADPMPFVLFEPRTSADLYLSVEPFFGVNMVPTKHLIVLKLNMAAHPSYAYGVLASDVIKAEDIPHLWMLYAEKKEKWPTFGVFNYTWRSQKLVDKREPDILLMGYDYQRNFGERAIDLASKRVGKFSYMRHGAAMLYLPTGKKGLLVVTLEPRDEKSYVDMLKEIKNRLENGELGSDVTMGTDGKFITLTSKVASEDKPVLKTIARYDGEFWLNVRLQEKEL